MQIKISVLTIYGSPDHKDIILTWSLFSAGVVCVAANGPLLSWAVYRLNTGEFNLMIFFHSLTGKEGIEL